jgi:hypothetical protein
MVFIARYDKSVVVGAAAVTGGIAADFDEMVEVVIVVEAGVAPEEGAGAEDVESFVVVAAAVAVAFAAAAASFFVILFFAAGGVGTEFEGGAVAGDGADATACGIATAAAGVDDDAAFADEEGPAPMVVVATAVSDFNFAVASICFASSSFKILSYSASAFPASFKVASTRAWRGLQ